MKYHIIAASLATTLFVPILKAQDTLPPKRIEASGSLGATQNSGNSSALNFALGNKLKFSGVHWILNQDFALAYGEAADSVIASFATAGLRAERTLRPWFGLYALGRFDRNGLQGIARRFEEGLGFDFKPLRSERNQLSITTGASLFQQTLTDGSSSENDANYPALRFGADYLHKFTSLVSLGQTVEYLPNLANNKAYLFNTETVVVAPISQRFALKFAYLARYNNEPPIKNGERLNRFDGLFSTGLTFAY